MVERTVRVHSDTVVISVHQKSKSVWIAIGTYLDKRYEATGRSESQAASAWAEAARYHTN